MRRFVVPARLRPVVVLLLLAAVLLVYGFVWTELTSPKSLPWLHSVIPILSVHL